MSGGERSRGYGRPTLSTAAARVAAVLAPALLGLGVLAAPLPALAATGDAAVAPAAGVAARTVVRWRDIQTEAGATRIRLETSAPPKLTTRTSAQPPKVEVSFSEAELKGLPARIQVADGTIEAVETRVRPDGGELTVTLAGPGGVDVVPWDGGIDLLVRLNAASPAASSAAAASPLVRSLPSPDRVVFTLGGAPTNLSGFVLSDGKRLVVDAEGVTIPSEQAVEELSAGPVARVRMARQDGRIRAVIETREAGALEEHRLEKTADGFVVFLGRGAAAEAKAQAPATQAAAKPPVADRPAAPPAAAPSSSAAAALGGGAVANLGFRQDGGKSLIEVTLSKAAGHVVREASPQRLVVDILRTSLPDKFRRALDTSAFPGPVRLVAAYARAGKAKTTDTRLVVDLRKPAPYRVDADGARLTVVVEGGVPEPPVKGVADVRREGQEAVVIEGKPGSAPPRKDEPAAAKEPSAKAAAGESASQYTGRRLSMDFMDADVRNVLRLIGEVSGLNMVTGDDVQGKVTVRLVDVPWDQALEVILRTKNFDQVRDGNVIRIAPADKLAAEKARAIQAEKGADEKAPLVSDIVSVNYANAAELLDKIKAILTTRGSVAVDQRTNSLLVKDVADKVRDAKSLVIRLDTPTPQVLIEARIVEVGTNYSQDLGVQWGGRYNKDAAHGNTTNWAFPNSIGVVGATGTGNFAVNFPAAVSAGGPGGALAITLGHVGDVLNLDLRISALESAGHGRVVSAPRVSTLDNRTAEISQGVEIPFTTSTQEKIETKSIDYLLKLNVTPHVTADKSIIMKINLTKDSPSSTYFAADSKTPAKETRAATTEVLVKDGETTVIGGIITDTKSDQVTGTPFLSKIPWLGALFRNTVKSDQKTELVIFITPKIVNPTPLVSNL